MGTLRAWLFPDLASLVSLVTLGYCLLVWDAPRRLFRDADSGWHIRTGEGMLSRRALPRTDPYSFTRGGQPWVAWEWGADLMMGAAHRAAGLSGVAWLYLCALTACAWLWLRLHWVAGGNFFIACAMAAPMLSTTNLHWLARPHVLGWVMLLAALHCAERAGVRFRPGQAACILAGSALWANLHASFFLGPLIALLYAAGHWLRAAVWQPDGAPDRARARWLLRAAGVSVLGALANPYGWRLHRHVAEYLSNSELLARIGEFQSFNFHAEGAGQILLGVGLAGLGAVAAVAVRRPAHFLWLALLLAAALRAARALPLLALAGLPAANGAITAALRRAVSGGGLQEGVRLGLERFLAYSDRLRALDRGVSGAALVVAAAVLALVWLRTPAVAARAGFPPEEFPVEAAEQLAKLPEEIRLLSSDKYGGYLIYRFAGRRKVFFDGRSDFYGADYMKQYGRLMQARPGWRRQLASFGFTHALLPRDSPLAEALEEAGWKRLYRDRVATLLEAPPGGLKPPVGDGTG